MALPWRPIKSETPSEKLDWTPKLFGGMFIPTWFSGGPDLSRWKLLKLKCEWILGYQSKSSVGRCRGSKIEIIKTHRSNFTVQNVRKNEARWCSSKPKVVDIFTATLPVARHTLHLHRWWHVGVVNGLWRAKDALNFFGPQSVFQRKFFQCSQQLDRVFPFVCFTPNQVPFFLRFFLLYQVTYFSRKTKLEVSHQVVASFWAVVVVARRRVTW